jgi:hypothetical protein
MESYNKRMDDEFSAMKQCEDELAELRKFEQTFAETVASATSEKEGLLSVMHEELEKARAKAVN